MSGFDVILALVLAAFIVSGFTKGLVAKILSLAALVTGIVICAQYGKDIAVFLAGLTGLNEVVSGVVGVAAIFIILFILAKIVTRAFRKISIFRIWDKLGGAVLGFLEGALLLSLLLLFIARLGFQSEGPALGKSYLYQPIKNFAPMVYRTFISREPSNSYFDKFFEYLPKDKPSDSK